MEAIYLAYFFGAAFLVNGIPHFVSGLQGKSFPTPFAKEGSSSVFNVVWGFINFVIAYLLLFKIVALNIQSPTQMIAVTLGSFLLAVYLAWRFAQIKTISHA